MKKFKFQVYDYDVWENSRDGFEVNNIYPALIGNNLFNSKEVFITLAENCTNKDIIKALKKSGWLKKTLKDKCFIIEGDFDYGLYISYDTTNLPYYPVCELRRL